MVAKHGFEFSWSGTSLIEVKAVAAETADFDLPEAADR
jgi:hypothetical protein